MRIDYHARTCLTAVLFFAATDFGALAQGNPVLYRDVETKYVFGFTEGSGIGLTRLRDQSRVRIHAEPVCSVRARRHGRVA